MSAVAVEPRRKAFKGSRLMDPEKRRAYHEGAKEEMRLRREASLEALTTEAGWRDFALACLRFPYSWRNCALIAARCPNASVVMTAGRWKSEGLSIQRGEEALWITRPEPGKGFRTLHLFDVSQTTAPADYMVERVGWTEAEECELHEAVEVLLAAVPGPETASEAVEAGKALDAVRKG